MALTRWFGHLGRMITGRLPVEEFQANPAGRRPRGRARSRWRDDISALAWKRLGIPQSELADVAEAREGRPPDETAATTMWLRSAMFYHDGTKDYKNHNVRLKICWKMS